MKARPLRPGVPTRMLPLIILASALTTGCRGGRSSPSRVEGGAAALPPALVRFVDVARQAGIHFKHTNGRSGRFYFPETMGSGCAFLDYDGDGRLDLFLVNSSRLPGFAGKGPFYPALYRNRGDGTFQDVTHPAGLAVDGYGMGVAVGDYDNDGHPDLYLTALGPNHLFHNNGRGAFTDVTRRARVGDPRFSTSAAFFDYNRDGYLDLFVCNYCQWTPATNRVCHDSAGHSHMCNPSFFPGSRSTLYRNRGDGTFADVTEQAGVANSIGKALGVTVFDVDGDGFPDLIVANDLEPNALYHNQGNGTFRERGIESGIAYGVQGRARAGMGIDTADLTGSGREDVLIGNFSGERAALFRDGGGGQFVDVAADVGLGAVSYPLTTFGAGFVDFDRDGQKDICLVNGHPDENIGLGGSGATFAQPMALFHNEGGRFREVTAEAGPGMRGKLVGRGLAVGDFDGDGAPDLLVTENNGPARLLHNESASEANSPSRSGSVNHWLAIRLRGVRSNRDGLGTRVVLQTAGHKQIGWVRSGSSYGSDSEHVARFGLGQATQADVVELHWPSGTVQTLRHVKANQMLPVTEAAG